MRGVEEAGRVTRRQARIELHLHADHAADPSEEREADLGRAADLDCRYGRLRRPGLFGNVGLSQPQTQTARPAQPTEPPV
ncbi:MAG TPA: hypothetical protein VFI28_00770, partial [Candidatus Limnocylindrales bacterium]|nr:hypothetical protein [Candidatus Limnocylindrales bacterium]